MKRVAAKSPKKLLNLEKDSQKLEVELLKAVDGPYKLYSPERMQAVCEKIVLTKAQMKRAEANILAEIKKERKAGKLKPWRPSL